MSGFLNESTGGSGGGTINGTATATQVAYGASTNALTSDANFTRVVGALTNISDSFGAGLLSSIQLSSTGFGGIPIIGAGMIQTSPTNTVFAAVGDATGVSGPDAAYIVYGFDTSGNQSNIFFSASSAQIQTNDAFSNQGTLQIQPTQVTIGYVNNGGPGFSGLQINSNGLTSLLFANNTIGNFPSSDGTTGQVLTTDGSRNWTFQNGGSGSPQDLATTLGIGNSNGGIAIHSSANSQVLIENSDGSPLYSVNGSGNPLIQSYNTQGGNILNGTLEFDSLGNLNSNGNYTSVGTPVFSGSGLDDLSTTSGYISPGANTFTLTIDGTNVAGIAMNGSSGTWIAGDTVTSSSGGSATIAGVAINGTMNRIMSLSGTTGTFLNGDTITDTTSSDTATLVGDLFPLDTFTWTTVGGPTFTSVPIVGGNQLLSFFLYANYASQTGHTIGDSWSINIVGYLMTGLSIDYINDIYSFGDTTGQNNGTKLVIIDSLLGGRSAMISRIFTSEDVNGDIGIRSINGTNPHVTLGDVNGSGNLVTFEVNDGAQTVTAIIPNGVFSIYGFGNVLSDRIALFDNANRAVTLGDVDNDFSGTFQTIDDPSQTFIFSKPNFSIASVPYVFPGSQGGATTALLNDGSGNLSWGVIGGSGVTSISTTGPITGGTITTTGTIGITQANTSTNGYLSNTDWNTFNGKLSTVTADGPLSGSGTSGSHLVIANAAADGTTKGAATFTASDFNSSAGLISLDYVNGQSSTASQNGFLSSTDWTAFNSKASNSGIVDWSASASPTGFASITTTKFTYQKVGNVVTCSIYIAGVSNSTSLGFTLPFAAYSGTGAPGVQIGTGLALDNNGLNNYPGIIQVSSGSTTVAANPLTALGAASIGVWTAINTKFIIVNFTYICN